MQYNAIQRNTMQYNAIQCNTMQYKYIHTVQLQYNTHISTYLIIPYMLQYIYMYICSVSSRAWSYITAQLIGWQLRLKRNSGPSGAEWDWQGRSWTVDPWTWKIPSWTPWGVHGNHWEYEPVECFWRLGYLSIFIYPQHGITQQYHEENLLSTWLIQYTRSEKSINVKPPVNSRWGSNRPKIPSAGNTHGKVRNLLSRGTSNLSRNGRCSMAGLGFWRV